MIKLKSIVKYTDAFVKMTIQFIKQKDHLVTNSKLKLYQRVNTEVQQSFF